MIFEKNCSIFNNHFFFLFQFSLFKTVILGYFFIFGLKHPKITKVDQKTSKIINLPYDLSHFIHKNPLFDIDLFFGPLTWNCPKRRKKMTLCCTNDLKLGGLGFPWFLSQIIRGHLTVKARIEEGLLLTATL